MSQNSSGRRPISRRGSSGASQSYKSCRVSAGNFRVNQGAVRRNRRRRLIRLTFRILTVFLLMSISAGIGTIGYWLYKSPNIRQAASTTVTGGLSPAKAFPGQTELNILLLGKDEDRNNRGQVVETLGRTDTIVLAHISFVDDRINLLSIPRDTLVRIPGYRGRHKINAAHAFGGPELAMETVEELTGIKPDGHLRIDYKLFAEVIDAAGGVVVEVDKPLNYDDNWGQLHIHLQPGKQKLDGREALGMVRYRKSNDGEADTDHERIARQQRLIGSLKRQFAKPSTLIRMPQITETVFSNADTTLSTAQLMSLASFTRGIGRENIRMEVLPSQPSRSALRMDEDKALPLIDELFRHQPPPTETQPG